MKKLIILIFLLSFFQAYAINVVFRLDDPRLQADSVSMRTVQLFLDKGVPLSIAVVPCNKQEQAIIPETMVDSLYISELQHKNIELALHGFNHQDINRQGEFGGLGYNEAQRRVRIGGGHFERLYFAENQHLYSTV